MATGTTADSNLKRNELIEKALRKLRAIPPAAAGPTVDQLDSAIQQLNLILRQEDLKGVGLNKNLWAISDESLFLAVGQYIYTTNDSLKDNILDLVSVIYRDSSGDDTPVDIISREGYETLGDKNETGDVEKVYFKQDIALASQSFYPWPVPGSVATTSEVIGSDGKNYKCTMAHTSASGNEPVTGASWKLYWSQQGSSGSAWITATDYTNGELLRYSYKRPLYDFDLPTDNPDMPAGWGNYLVLRLAHDLSPEYGIDLEERTWLKKEYLEARAEIFPSTKPIQTNPYNKAMFY